VRSFASDRGEGTGDAVEGVEEAVTIRVFDQAKKAMVSRSEMEEEKKRSIR
jgi:hypothetical protein